jgi:DNA-binding transcriptional ArsR family regulator
VEGGDEADSIIVVVTAGEKARGLRQDFADNVVSTAIVRGHLVTFSKLIENLKELEGGKDGIRHQQMRYHLEILEQMGVAPSYYLLVSDDTKTWVELKKKPAVDYYSAYIWQCWVPREWKNAKNPAETNVDSAYFLWEHTNVADADVVRYSMDSLLRKKAFLEERIKKEGFGRGPLSGKLAMLQHGMNESLLSRGTHKFQTPDIKSTEFLRLLQKVR